MRSVGSEIASVLTVLAVLAMVAAMLPYEMLSFRSEERARPGDRFTTAFVRLSPEGERLALRTAKTSWSGGGGSVRHLRADMSFADLPDDPLGLPVLTAADMMSRQEPSLLRCGPSPFLPSLASDPPKRIEPSGSADDLLQFPKKELLKMD